VGFALATTFIVAFFVLLAGFTMAALASFNYSMLKQTQLRDEAFDAAQAGLNYAVAELIKSQAWGASNSPGALTDVLPQTQISPALASASDPQHFYVSFNPAGVPSGYPAGLPWSINNLSGGKTLSGPLDPADGMPHQVPPGSALIFAAGVAGPTGGRQEIRIVEALLQAGAFPFALAATSTVSNWECNKPRGCYPGGPNYRVCTIFSDLVDSGSGLDRGSILVRAMPCATFTPWCGHCPGRCPPCVTTPAAVFLAHGSQVSGKVIYCNKGHTNVVACCHPPAYTWGGAHPCMPPIAQAVETPLPSCNPQSKNQQLPDVRKLAGPMVDQYTCPATYVCGGASKTYCFPSYCGGGAPVNVTVYTRVPCTFKPNFGTCCPIIVGSCTLMVAKIPACGKLPILRLGRPKGMCMSHPAGRPLELAPDITLTVQNAYLNIPTGIVGPGCCEWPSGTLIILPRPLTPPKCPCTGPPLCGMSQIQVIPGGGFTAARADVSILAVGNLTLGDVKTCASCLGTGKSCTWTVNGLLVSVGGQLNFYWRNTHVVGAMIAEDPYTSHWTCDMKGQETAPLGEIFLENGAWVSYCPSAARASWLGSTLHQADTTDGLQVVYWREIQPGY
jgi:hypothetical protein